MKIILTSTMLDARNALFDKIVHRSIEFSVVLCIDED